MSAAKSSFVLATALLSATLLAPAALAQSCPDGDLDTYADCTVAGCDPTGLTCGDCDDGDDRIHPGMSDTCDHVDNNCDGAVDEGYDWLTASEKILDPQRHGADKHGYSIAEIGDVDGDDVSDFVVGSPFNSSGRVVLYSGADLSTICRTTDGANGENIGASVAGIGDVTGDGIPDFAAAVPRAAGSVGAIAIYSGDPGDSCSLVRRCVDPAGAAGDYLGSDSLARGQGLAGWVDITGDGVPEIIAGAPDSDRAALNTGIVIVFNPAIAPNCSVVHRAFDPGPQAGAMLGRSVVGLDDVTSDGIADFAAGADGYTDVYGGAGTVEIFSGASGSPFVRRLLDPNRASDHLGYSLDAISDMDSDGLMDLVAGAPNRDTAAGADAGQALILSSQGGSNPVIRRLDEGLDGANAEYLGRSVAVADDTDGDGIPEILAGAYNAYSAMGTRDGHAVLFAGGDGSVMAVFEDPEGLSNDYLGWAVEDIADITGDGAGDFLVAAPEDDIPRTGNGAGSVLLFAIESDCDLDGVPPFGGDCDDQDADRYEGNPEICDALDNDCDTFVDEDEDGDSYDKCDDVDDTNPQRYPGAPELCNGLDDDGDTLVDEGVDLDSDGYETPCDCNDDPATGDVVHPGATEICNHVDDDCGAVDEGYATVSSLEKLHDPAIAGAFYGRAVAAIGDVDSDGVEDFAVGYPGDATGGSSSGSVMLHSGADRSPICRALNDQAGASQLGNSVAGIGDVDEDGLPDFAAAAYLSDAQAYDAGEVVLFSGADCSVIRHCTDPAGISQDHLGEDNGLSGWVDITGDGVPEIIAGAQLANHSGLNDAGKAIVLSGADCSVVYTLTDPLALAYDYLGTSVAGLGDVTGDGIPDVAVGETRDDYSAADGGSVLIFSGADGTLARRLIDPSGATSDYLGWDVTGIEDINNDGWPDIVASARARATGTGGDAGQILVFSGMDGDLLYRAQDADGTGNDHLGWSVAAVPDMDGDGLQEILAGAPYGDGAGGTDAGRAVLFSGINGSKIRSYDDPGGAQQDYAGFWVAAIGDLNGDGGPDLLVSASHDDVPKHGADRGGVLLWMTESDCDSDGFGPSGNDCDDADQEIYAGAPEVCDTKDNDCDLATDEDEDGDGYDACQEDAQCDPGDLPNGNPLMYPGAPELCNGLDDNCDGSVDNGVDADSDGYTTPCDCNDDPVTGPAVHPGATEICNHIADDCDGVDEGFDPLISSEKVVDLYPVAGDYFAWSLASIGDVNEDAVPDFVVGAPSDDSVGWDMGQVTLYSGADRLVICRAATAGNVGRAVSAVGDLDGDGTPDFLASAPAADAIVLYSGADCAEIARCTDPYTAVIGLGSEHGLAGWIDVTGDGVAEILAGAASSTQTVHQGGAAFAFTYSRSSGSCSLLFEMFDPDLALYDYLGFSISGIGDVTGDGVADVAAGAPGDDSIADANGAVVIFSGADGSFARRLLDPSGATRDYLGYAVAGIEDLNGDGWPDIAAGADQRNTAAGADAGEVVLFSGKDGSVLLRASDAASEAGARLGYTLDVLDDVDGDGLQDLLAGARYADVGGYADAGRAVILSTADGSKIATLENSANAAINYFGYAVASAGDLTGDGIPELLVGTPFENGAAGADTGAFMVFSVAADCDSDSLAPFDDCDDADANTWRVPTETRNLTIDPDKETITWDEPEGSGQGSGTLLYDTLRSWSGADFMIADCVESDESDRSTIDDFEPSAGFVVYYLTRAQNACGDGDLGTWGEEDYPRTGEACP